MCREEKQTVFTKGNISHLGPHEFTRTKKDTHTFTLLPHLPPTTVSEALHDGIDLRFEHLGEFRAVLVDAGRLAVVQPGVVEHEPDVVHVLPRLLVLARVQLALDSGQVDGILHNVKVVLLQRGRGMCKLCLAVF